VLKMVLLLLCCCRFGGVRLSHHWCHWPHWQAHCWAPVPTCLQAHPAPSMCEGPVHAGTTIEQV